MEKVRKISFFGFIASLIVLASSCVKNNTEGQLLEDEKRTLKQYFITHNLNVQPRPSGLYYLPTDTGTGIKPELTDVILFNYTIRLANDKVLVSNIDSIAKMNGFYNPANQYKPLEYRVSWWFSGLQEGLQLMREGGKATFIIPSSLAYGSNGNSSTGVGSYTTMIMDVELIKVIHDPLQYELENIHNFLQDTTLASLPTSRNDSGVYNLVYDEGTGPLPGQDTTLTLSYTLKLLDGTVIQTVTSDAPFIYSISSSDVIPGFKQGVLKMKKGETDMIIIPYKQGYGEAATSLPPFSTLVYIITILDMTK